jgi:DNA-binding NarL/FixJ family response regulator
VGSATSVDEALSLVRSENCDVVLVRNNLPNEGALKLTQILKDDDTGVKILVIGVAEQEEVILRFIEAGAAGYVLSTESVTDDRNHLSTWSTALWGGSTLLLVGHKKGCYSLNVAAFFVPMV